MTEDLQQKILDSLQELTQRLSNMEDTLDGLCDKLDTDLEALLKAVNDAPNKTGTTLEKNQQVIFKVTCENRDLLKSIGANIEEMSNEQPQEPQAEQ